jgi:hypothetical protein
MKVFLFFASVFMAIAATLTVVDLTRSLSLEENIVTILSAIAAFIVGNATYAGLKRLTKVA